MVTITTKSATETKNIGYMLAKLLKPDSTIALNGDLGTGKTVLVSGIAEYFGLNDQISSPTFTIVNEYEDLKTGNKICHFDVYRLENSDEFLATGLDEYLGNNICIIEWADIIKDILPSDTIYVYIYKDDNINNEAIRHIDIEGIDKK